MGASGKPNTENNAYNNYDTDDTSPFSCIIDAGERPVPRIIRNTCTVREVRDGNLHLSTHGTKQPGCAPLTFREVRNFPVKRRPMKRDLSTVDQAIIDEWVANSGITVGKMAVTEDQVNKARRLLYTWKDCFAFNLRELRATDLIYHTIDLKPGVKPHYSKIPRYNAKERAFAETIFPKMEDAGIIARIASEWGCRSQFPPKKPGSEDLRVVHNFKPLNAATTKPAYPTHRTEEVVETVIKPKFGVYFIADASNGYWAVPMKPGDEYKTGVVSPHGHYCYLRMGQGLKGASHTYAQFGDLTFGHLPKTEIVPAQDTILKDHGDAAFTIFADDHIGAATSFDSMFEFLHEKYFPRAAFGPIYLAPKKTFLFMDQLDFIGFTGSHGTLRPSMRHKRRIRDWPEPQTKEEVEAFLWITPFLRVFIPGRAEHALIIKKAYLKEVPVGLAAGSSKKSVRTKWVDTGQFVWGDEQRKSFQAIKDAVSDNVMGGADPEAQYHLATDASKLCLGGVLFQLRDTPIGVEATDSFKEKIRIIMFLSF